MKKIFVVYAYVFICLLLMLFTNTPAAAQMLRLPEGNTNYKCKTARQLAATNIEITWNAPGVKGREGKIWGTDVAPYGFTVLGLGSFVASPWRAGRGPWAPRRRSSFARDGTAVPMVGRSWSTSSR